MLANPSVHGGAPSPPPPTSSLLRSLHSRTILSFPFPFPALPRSRNPRLHPVHHLHSPSPRRPPRIRASASEPEQLDYGILSTPQRYSVKIPVGNREILVETGHIGRQASASVTVTDGETIVYASVCLSDVPSEPSDFFPLSVNYQERLSAAGRTSGGFFKREGRAKDHEMSAL